MTEQLARCPFCGSTDTKKVVFFSSQRRMYMKCFVCGAQGPFCDSDLYSESDKNTQEAIEAWNHRPIETVLRGEFDEADRRVYHQGAVINAMEEHIKKLEAELAELKARKCETCKWIGDHGDGPLCHKDGVDVYFVTNNFCCSAWERKEQS